MTGVQTCALPIFFQFRPWQSAAGSTIIWFQNRMRVRLDIGIVQHVDRVPGTDRQLVQVAAVVRRSITHLTTDAATRIDLVITFRWHRADNFIDAIDRAHCCTGIAGRATVLVDHIEVTSFFFPIRRAGSEVVRHGNSHRIVTAFRYLSHPANHVRGGKIVSPVRLPGREDRLFWPFSRRISCLWEQNRRSHRGRLRHVNGRKCRSDSPCMTDFRVIPMRRLFTIDSVLEVC